MKNGHWQAAAAGGKPLVVNKAVTGFDIQKLAGSAVIDEIPLVDGAYTGDPPFQGFHDAVRQLFAAAFPAAEADRVPIIPEFFEKHLEITGLKIS